MQTVNKRNFLLSSAAWATLAAPGVALAQAGAAKPLAGPGLLTVTGAIGKGNRGAFDPVRDQMMGKLKLGFDKAQVFDFAALVAMPAVTIKPTLEYDGKVHTLKGPLLTDVLKAAGVTAGDSAKLAMRAVDGYSPEISLADARKYRYIVATHMDGAPMNLGGLGPLWALYEPDKFADMAAKTLSDRFANCPWALFSIEVKAG